MGDETGSATNKRMKNESDVIYSSHNRIFVAYRLKKANRQNEGSV